MRRQVPVPAQGRPFLTRAWLETTPADGAGFPFSIPAFSKGIDIAFETVVTFFVGENGSGKSTLLEALAAGCGFNPEGGSRNHRYTLQAGLPALTPHLRLAWSPKVTQGFFLRAESFFNFATYIEELNLRDAYGGKSLHGQSHGESFLALFTSRFRQGIFILDEPEAALSPQRQLTFLRIIHDLEAQGQSQLIIATHSPILLSYPGATIYSFDGDEICAVNPDETNHVRLTRDFLNEPDRYLRRLFAPDQDNE
jgi:predicted ATPase